MDISKLGMIEAHKPLILTFHPGIYSESALIYYGDIFNGIIVFFFFLCVLFIIRNKKNWKKRFRYLMSYNGILNLSIVCSFIATVAMTLAANNLDYSKDEIAGFINDEKPLDIRKVAFLSVLSYKARGVFCGLVILRIMEVFHLNFFFSKVLSLIHRLFLKILVILLLVFPFALGLGLITHQHWGLRDPEFNSFLGSLQALVMLSVKCHSFQNFQITGFFTKLVAILIIFVFCSLVFNSFLLGLIYYENDCIEKSKGTVKVEQWKIKELFSWLKIFTMDSKKEAQELESLGSHNELGSIPTITRANTFDARGKMLFRKRSNEVHFDEGISGFNSSGRDSLKIIRMSMVFDEPILEKSREDESGRNWDKTFKGKYNPKMYFTEEMDSMIGDQPQENTFRMKKTQGNENFDQISTSRQFISEGDEVAFTPTLNFHGSPSGFRMRSNSDEKRNQKMAEGIKNAQIRRSGEPEELKIQEEFGESSSSDDSEPSNIDKNSEAKIELNSLDNILMNPPSFISNSSLKSQKSKNNERKGSMLNFLQNPYNLSDSGTSN